MTFTEAIAALLQGKRIRRPNWDEGGYYALDKRNGLSREEILYTNPNLATPEFTRVISPFGKEDLTATDWEIIPIEVDFATAMKAVCEGKTIRRRSSALSIRANASGILVRSAINDDRYILCLSDIEATDWIILGEKE